MHFYGSNLGPLARDHLGPWDLGLNKLGKGAPSNATYQRTTCIKAQKWPPTKLTHIVMNNSCVVPLTETDKEIGDRHYIWGQNGVKGYDP